MLYGGTPPTPSRAIQLCLLRMLPLVLLLLGGPSPSDGRQRCRAENDARRDPASSQAFHHHPQSSSMLPTAVYGLSGELIAKECVAVPHRAFGRVERARRATSRGKAYHQVGSFGVDLL